jgi:predicted 2-oxoglutarate/Fe(II)-dependent dioxygenase YbiX
VRFGVLVFETFLQNDLVERLHRAIAAHRPEMVASQLIEGGTGAVMVDANRRGSVTMAQVPKWIDELFRTRLQDLFTFAAARFELDVADTPSDIGVHVTVTPPGGGFVPHIDNGSPNVASRLLSWVYFLPSEEPFEGGELIVYQAVERRALLEVLTSRVRVSPIPNCLAIFPSAFVHEVTPVEGFGERNTVHGWFHILRA